MTNFTSIANKQLKFTIPIQTTACSGSNNIISYNDQQSTFTFSYNPALALTVTSLSKNSSSPILKSTITITGTNLGTQGTTFVFLVQNGVKKYELSVTSMTSTSINCILGGGRSGIYDVVVQSPSGMSTISANTKFTYKIVVTSLSINSGHKGGGYTLTVQGYNFATSAGTNNVFIGPAKNSICKILTFTDSVITCKMPRMISDYTVNTPLTVVVTGRIVE